MTMRTILQTTRSVDHVRFNLTLVRHAETHANSEGIIQGLVDTELSNIGYLQSKALGRYLQYHRFSRIYSSDLKRAAETTRQIHSSNCVSQCNIQFESLLRERMYGVAQGKTRQWLRELAKESGVPYVNFTPPGAESASQVRERAITFFRKVCQELLEKYGPNSSVQSIEKSYTSNSLSKQDKNLQVLSRSVSLESLTNEQFNVPMRKRSLSSGDQQETSLQTITIPNSHQSSIDSALDLSSVSSDQRSISSSISTMSRNSSFEKHRYPFKSPFQSPYNNLFSEHDILVVSHGAVIRELIKYFACDLQTDIGKHFDTIQDIAPNTSVTRFQVTYSINEDSTSSTLLELVDYHNKTHLINSNDEYNLDVVNKCSL